MSVNDIISDYFWIKDHLTFTSTMWITFVFVSYSRTGVMYQIVQTLYERIHFNINLKLCEIKSLR